MPKKGKSGRDDTHSACHTGSPKTVRKELEVQEDSKCKALEHECVSVFQGTLRWLGG